MDTLPRHQCLIYDGAPSRHLPALAAVMRQKLEDCYRCVYLNSAPMVAGMGSYLAAAGVDVSAAVAEGSLVLSSERPHLRNGRDFEIDGMIQQLASSVAQAKRDGYQGLWATGDMTWELGPEQDFASLLEYELRLDRVLRENPALSGICQYHADTMPRGALREGLVAHPCIFINHTLSLVNPHYCPAETITLDATADPALDPLIDRLIEG